jgi:hypothetical protein
MFNAIIVQRNDHGIVLTAKVGAERVSIMVYHMTAGNNQKPGMYYQHIAGAVQYAKPLYNEAVNRRIF